MHLDNFTGFGTQHERRTAVCEQKVPEMMQNAGKATLQKALTLKEMQDILQIGTSSAYSLLHSHAFPVVKIGRSYRIPAEPFYDWLNHSNAVIP